MSAADAIDLRAASADEAQPPAAAAAIALGVRLDRLVRAGAGRFDPPGVRCIEILLERARTIGGEGGTRLAERAAARLVALEEALVRARGEAREALGRLAEAGLAPDGDVAEAMEAGDYANARRAADRARLEARRARRSPERRWLRRVARRAASRVLALPHDVAMGLARLEEVGPSSDLAARRTAQELGGVVSLALFRETAETARAQLAVARALDNLPEQPGPYNPQLLAARALATLSELSPAYLRAFMANLDDLARLEAAIVAMQPEPEPAKKPAKKRKKPVRSKK